MPTIREVAKHAGVSTATVSRIISGDPSFSVSEATKNKVFDVVKELGYVPYFRRSNHVAVPKNINMQVGCIFSSMYGNEQLDPTFIQRMDVLEKLLAEHNIKISFAMSELEIKKTSRLQKLRENSPHGLIFMVNTFFDLYKELRSIVPHGVGIDCFYPDMDNVTYDKERGMERLVHYLVEQGRQRIAYIGGPGRLNANLNSSRRFHGYRNALESYDLYDPTYAKNCTWKLEECYTHTQALLNLPQKPDAIILGSDNLSFSAYRAIYEKGLQIPKDIAVIGGTKLPISDYLSPKLSTLEIPVEQIAKTAIEILLKRIQGDDTPPVEMVYSSKMIIRESTQDK